MNVNTATVEELRGLPGIGEKTAAKIIASRPVGSREGFEALIPPSAMVAIEKGELELSFDAPVVDADPIGEPVLKDDEIAAFVGPTPVEGPVEPVLEMGDMRLRRVLYNETERFESLFDTGTRFLCLWNMWWGPSLEARVPRDTPVQEEIAMWAASKGIEVLFAHYGPSVRVGTRSRGLIPIVLFEILEEKEEGDAEQLDEGQQ